MPSSSLRICRPRRLPILLALTTIAAMSLFYILLSLAPCIVPGLGACYHGYQSAYSFDANAASHRSWMAPIPDHVNVTALSVPGTHDTMTYDIGTEVLQCQLWNLTVQLGAGLRYFDIRARLRDDELQIYHSDGYTGFSYTDVLLAMFAFLDANPSEAIIMRLKEEGSSLGTNTKTFEEAFNYYRHTSPETSAGCDEHMYIYDPSSSSAPIPTLGALRSKILILQNFDADDGPYGIAWEGDQMVLEDYWEVDDVQHLKDKWDAIRDALQVAAKAPLDDNDVMYLSHLSASVGVLPIEAAAGPLNHTVEGMNDMTGGYLKGFGEGDYTRTGVVIIDFPGEKLVDVIIDWNKNLS